MRMTAVAMAIAPARVKLGSALEIPTAWTTRLWRLARLKRQSTSTVPLIASTATSARAAAPAPLMVTRFAKGTLSASPRI